MMIDIKGLSIANRYQGASAYRILDKQNGDSLYIRADELAIQKDSKTGMEFIINMDQPFSYNVMVTEELRTILGEDIPQIPMQGGLTVNQDPKTGLQYLAIEGNEAQGVSVLIK